MAPEVVVEDSMSSSSSLPSSRKFLRCLLVAMYLLLCNAIAAAAAASAATTIGDASMHYYPHQLSSSLHENLHTVILEEDDIIPIDPLHRRVISQGERHGGGLVELDFASAVPSNYESSEIIDRRTSNIDVERRATLASSSVAMDLDTNTTFAIPSASPSSSTTTTLLKSPWWTKIKEYAGPHSYNFVPGSRRAASSVVYTYSYTSDEEGDDEQVAHRRNRHRSMVTKNATTSTTMTQDGDDDDAQTVTSNNATHNSSFTSIDESGGVSNETIINPTSSSPDSMNATTDTNRESDIQTTSQQQQHPTLDGSNEHSPSSSLEEEEYMIVSGGYTDHDWKTFPVYAFPITSAIHTRSGQWIDITPSASNYDDIDTTLCHTLEGEDALANLNQEAKFIEDITTSTTYNNGTDDGENDDPWEHASPCAPFGRMGHISVIHGNKLYVFGGLIYAEEEQLTPGGGGGGYYYGRRTMFQLENIPYVYRLDLKEMLDARRAESEGNLDFLTKNKITGWQRIIPRVKKSSNTNGKSSSSSSLSAAEVLLTLVNRGEMQGGLWSSESSGGHDKLVMHGGLRIEKVDYDSYGLPSRTSSQIVELPLADIWAYDLVLDCWEKITNTYGKVRALYMILHENSEWMNTQRNT